MKKIPAAKTMLAVLSLIDSFCEVSARVNHVNAINSFYGLQDTQTLMERIIEKTHRTDQLHNLKIKIIKHIENMPYKIGAVLKFHYLKKQTAAQIAEYMKITERTVFRLIKQGIEMLSESLENLGINVFTFKQLLHQNAWIRSEYERHLCE